MAEYGDIKKSLFKLWDKLGVDFKSTDYFSYRFNSLNNYFKSLIDYYDISLGDKKSNEILSISDIMDTIQIDILNTVDDFLRDKKNNPLGLKIYNYRFTTTIGRQSINYDGDVKGTLYVKFKIPNDWECSDIGEYYGDITDCYLNETEIGDTIHKVQLLIRKRYGIGSNVNFTEDKGEEPYTYWYKKS
jgi:hypothetical protein